MWSLKSNKYNTSAVKRDCHFRGTQNSVFFLGCSDGRILLLPNNTKASFDLMVKWLGSNKKQKENAVLFSLWLCLPDAFATSIDFSASFDGSREGTYIEDNYCSSD